MKPHIFVVVGLVVLSLSLVSCTSLSGLPADLKDECRFYQQTYGFRFESVKNIPPALDEPLSSFATNSIDGFDFSNEVTVYILKNQFDVYRIYWREEAADAHPSYARADFTEEGVLVHWTARISCDPEEYEDEYVDSQGNHIFELEGRPLKVSDGGGRMGFSRGARETFSTEFTTLVVSQDTLFVNNLSYGTLAEVDEIFVDHAIVYVNGERKIGSIPDKEEWRWLHPEEWIAGSKYLNDRLVLFRWKESMSSGKTLFGREWIEVGNTRVECDNDVLLINKEAKIQLTSSDIVFLFRDEVYLLNEELRHKENITNQELDEALSEGGRIQRVWPSKTDVIMKKHIW